MRRWIVTALGKDRPGIVAAVTERLYRIGCNLEDSAMTRLGGEFTIMLVCSAPTRLSHPALSEAFRPLSRRLGLSISVKQLPPDEAVRPAKRGPAYLISVYGADRPGIVFHVSQALARTRVNITDVHTHRSPGGRGGSALYLLLLEVELPRRLKSGALERTLRQLGKRLGVEVSLRQADPDVL